MNCAALSILEQSEIVNRSFQHGLTRRGFIHATALAAGGVVAGCSSTGGHRGSPPHSETTQLSTTDLPAGSAPVPLPLPHFPDRLHAFVWRNWSLVPIERIAAVLRTSREKVVQLAEAMGLPTPPPRLTRDKQRRSYITVIKRNWHLLPYDQLLELLDWTPTQLADTLREDDFLFVKLGSLKPRCEPLIYQLPDDIALARERAMARVISEEFPDGLSHPSDAPFSFIPRLSEKPVATSKPRSTLPAARSPLSPRFCSSYFTLFGDPLLDSQLDPYPDGYLARLAESGVDGVWLHAVLSKLAPFPWDPGRSARFEERLNNLASLVTRARRQGISIYLYLNEPRAMPLPFFEAHPHIKGFAQGDQAALCTSAPEVQRYLIGSVASVCRAAPGLGGFFTITASENLTNCWSHNGGMKCPRCATRSPAEVIAEVNNLFWKGIQQGTSPQPRPEGIPVASSTSSRTSTPDKPGRNPALIVWDWGWPDQQAENIIARLPQGASLMSVSEWGLPIERGGVQSTVGEYSISAVGPGPRAQRQWESARRRGLKTIAKIQAGNTWELSAVPYIPAVANVAQHAANLSEAKVDGLMLGWTLGGYPSPNLEVVSAVEEARRMGFSNEANPGTNKRSELANRAMQMVATRRFGGELAPAIVQAWQEFSDAFNEFPFHIGLVYSAPLQLGPANLLWAQATNYHASMVGFPYDDLESWRSVYPSEIFISQLEKVAQGFDDAISRLKAAARRETKSPSRSAAAPANAALAGELNVAEAAAIHFRSAANQARFVLARRGLLAAKSAVEAMPRLDALEETLKAELTLARRLYAIQLLDARIGFEASNQYYYVPIDLVEKVLNCRHHLDQWLPSERAKWASRTAGAPAASSSI